MLWLVGLRHGAAAAAAAATRGRRVVGQVHGATRPGYAASIDVASVAQRVPHGRRSVESNLVANFLCPSALSVGAAHTSADASRSLPLLRGQPVLVGGTRTPDFLAGAKAKRLLAARMSSSMEDACRLHSPSSATGVRVDLPVGQRTGSKRRESTIHRTTDQLTD